MGFTSQTWGIARCLATVTGTQMLGNCAFILPWNNQSKKLTRAKSRLACALSEGCHQQPGASPALKLDFDVFSTGHASSAIATLISSNLPIPATTTQVAYQPYSSAIIGPVSSKSDTSVSAISPSSAGATQPTIVQPASSNSGTLASTSPAIPAAVTQPDSSNLGREDWSWYRRSARRCARCSCYRSARVSNSPTPATPATPADGNSC